MVTTLNPNTTNIYNTQNDKKYSGVVKVSSNGYYGTGSLLYDGMAILTAAHLFTDGNLQAEVTFDLPSGKKVISSSSVVISPLYDIVNDNNDMAIVWLSEQAPKDAQRYDIYRETDEINQTFSFSGYGLHGVGATGDDDTIEPYKLVAYNDFETQADILKDKLGNTMAWNPNDDILVADFDSNSQENDALGKFLDINDLGINSYEGMISSGDSGGPAFIDSKIAGVASYTSSLSTNGIYPDIDDQNNSSFGELGFWQRTSSYQQFIDENLRANYKNQPQTVEDVVKQITEGDAGDITINYFFLEIKGQRDNDEVLSVQFSTRDGSAKADEDYLSTSGQITVYPNEDHVLIPVEILGDTLNEDDEFFYLDIFDPVGASFENNQLILTAQRTIVDDDLFLA